MHSLAFALPVFEKASSSHVTHPVAPAMSWYDPALHRLQNDAPPALAYDPASHDAHPNVEIVTLPDGADWLSDELTVDMTMPPVPRSSRICSPASLEMIADEMLTDAASGASPC